MKTKLRFVERVQFEPTGTDVLQYRFRANDLYDPRHAIGGAHPRGFDEYMAIYNTFTVLGSKCSVTWMYEGYHGPAMTAGVPAVLIQSTAENDTSPALSPMICGLHKGLETLSAGAGEKQMEKDRTTWTYLTGTTGTKTLKQKLHVSEFFGKGTLVGSEGYTGTADSGPTEEIFWELWCGRCSDDYPQDTTKVVAYCTIEYDAVFTEPKTLGASS